MTYQELKDALYEVRENRKSITAKLSDLATLRERELQKIGNGAIDYSKDRIQVQSDPDKAIVEVLAHIDREYDRLSDAIGLLMEQNAYLESWILKQNGVGGEILRLFYIDCLGMKMIARRLNYTEEHTYLLRRQAIKIMLEDINEDEDDY